MSKTYYCSDCKRFVKSAWMPNSEPRCVCCGGDDLEKAYKCPICGDWAIDEYGCEWCKSEAEGVVKAFLKPAKTRKEKMAYVDLLSDMCGSVWVKLKIAEEDEEE